MLVPMERSTPKADPQRPQVCGNCPYILDLLQENLSQEQLQQCVPVEGRETTLSQEYCPGLVKAIVAGLLQTARHHDPHRFHQTNHNGFTAFAVHNFNVNDDLDSWQPIFDMAEKLFQKTASRTL